MWTCESKGNEEVLYHKMKTNDEQQLIDVPDRNMIEVRCKTNTSSVKNFSEGKWETLEYYRSAPNYGQISTLRGDIDSSSMKARIVEGKCYILV